MSGWVVHPHGHMYRAHVEGPPKGGGPMELFGRFEQGKALKAWLSRAFRVLSHALQGFHGPDHPQNHSQNLEGFWKLSGFSVGVAYSQELVFFKSSVAKSW